MKSILKNALAFVSILAVVFSLAACGNGSSTNQSSADQTSEDEQTPAEDAAVYKLTYATGNGSENGTYQNVEKVFIDLVREKSGGRIVIEEYIGGTLLGSGQAFEGARSGSCDIAFDMPAAYSGLFPVTTLLEQSCAGPASANAACALANEFKETYVPDLAEYDGVELLLIANPGPAVLVGNKAIRSKEDIKGKQIRTNATNNVAIERLGGTPVIINMNDVYDAYSTNLIDSGWFVPEAMYGFSLYEVAGNATVWPFNQSIIFIVMNSDSYNALPEDLQSIVQEAAKEVFENNVLGYFDRTYDEFLNLAKEKKADFTVIELSQDDLNGITETLWPLVEEYANTLDEQGYDGAGTMRWMQERAKFYNEQYGS
jgi:TRAP-type C4-dicarboxylate transport system substrate-binding protein